MIRATIHEAKTNLSRLIERAESGEDVVISRGKQEVVRLIALKPAAKGREPGLFKGEFEVGPAFFEPLPAEEMQGWE